MHLELFVSRAEKISLGSRQSLWDRLIGEAVIKSDDLHVLCTDLDHPAHNTETCLLLEPSGGHIIVRLKEFSGPNSARGAVDTAKQDIGLGLGSKGDTVLGALNGTRPVMEILASVLTRMGSLIKAIDELAKAHPYTQLTWYAVSSIHKAVTQQLEADQLLMSLVEAMEGALRFTLDLKDLPGKFASLEDNIAKICEQIAECAIFIREYTDHGFSRTFL